jgi:hypothetical protein
MREVSESGSFRKEKRADLGGRCVLQLKPAERSVVAEVVEESDTRRTVWGILESARLARVRGEKREQRTFPQRPSFDPDSPTSAWSTHSVSKSYEESSE